MNGKEVYPRACQPICANMWYKACFFLLPLRFSLLDLERVKAVSRRDEWVSEETDGFPCQTDKLARMSPPLSFLQQADMFGTVRPGKGSMERGASTSYGRDDVPGKGFSV